MAKTIQPIQRLVNINILCHVLSFCCLASYVRNKLISSDVLCTMRKGDVNYRLTEYWKHYQLLRNKVRTTIDTEQEKYFSEMFDQMKGNIS